MREICPKGQGGAERMPVYLPENWPEQLMALQPGLVVTGLPSGEVAGGAAAAAAAAPPTSNSAGSSEGGGGGGGSAPRPGARAAAQRGLARHSAGALFAAAEAMAAVPLSSSAPAASSNISPRPFAPLPLPQQPLFGSPLPARLGSLQLPSLPAPVAPPVLVVQPLPLDTTPPAGTPHAAALSPLSFAALTTSGGGGGTPRASSLPLSLPSFLAVSEPDWQAALAGTPTAAATPTSALAAALAATGLGPAAGFFSLHRVSPLQAQQEQGARHARSTSSDECAAPMVTTSGGTSPERPEASSEHEAEGHAAAGHSALAAAGLSWVHAVV